ncbi:MerR family transcriptional regulator [Jiella avicenniae]|uniref:MerR family transcriptional regulator n=1 Tax=Jiella avicenniae TaxID=2907202 RepID=A0A9X1NXY1_9HYPH|nr:MerR family transcriptional regulator [Jiella avicenniae]MCE7027765.1 MerR family transcriptional regulator [Jiella avicenniae]MCE7028807.1 MerR family transcriptional regulator [Jiella avicenniae]
MSDKGEDAFRTISEVAEELDLPQHVLRFWESRFAQIRPLKRGGGRRYYRPDDVELLRGIRYLLYVKGFTIKGVQRLLKENGSRFVMAIGSGDLAGLDDLAASTGQDGPDMPAEAPPAEVDDLDLIHPEPETVAAVGPAVQAEDARPAARPRPRALGGFLRRDRDGGEEQRLPRDSIETLDQVLLDLLECKRLLDQVR